MYKLEKPLLRLQTTCAFIDQTSHPPALKTAWEAQGVMTEFNHGVAQCYSLMYIGRWTTRQTIITTLTPPSRLARSLGCFTIMQGWSKRALLGSRGT